MCVCVCGKPTVQPILGDDVLDSSCKTNAIQCISFMSIWWYQEKKDYAGFNHEAFHAVSAKCKGQNSKHKPAAWGLDKEKKKFATSEETAYPMGLAKLLANCIAMALINLGVKAPEETLHQLKSTSLRSLQQMKAAGQSNSSFVPDVQSTCQTSSYDYNVARFSTISKISR